MGVGSGSFLIDGNDSYGILVMYFIPLLVGGVDNGLGFFGQFNAMKGEQLVEEVFFNGSSLV